MNEDIVVPERKLLLNSTIGVNEKNSICINRTTEKGVSEIIACISTESNQQRSSSDNLAIHVVRDYFVVEIEELNHKDGKITYTWWSVVSGWLGDTIVSIQDTMSQSLEATARRGKPVSVVFRFETLYTMHIILMRDSLDLFYYQTSEGLMKRCASYSENILPTYRGRYYIATFEDVTCEMADQYNFIATWTVGQSILAENIKIDLHVQDNTKIDIKLEHKPLNVGDTAKIICNASEEFSSLSWRFNNESLKVSNNHNIRSLSKTTSALIIYDIGLDDIGSYSCEIKTRCGSVNSSSITLDAVGQPQLQLTFHPETIRSVHNTVVLNASESLTVICHAILNEPNSKLLWYFGNESLGSAANQRTDSIVVIDGLIDTGQFSVSSELTIDSMNSTHSGNYTCKTSHKERTIETSFHLYVIIPEEATTVITTPIPTETSEAIISTTENKRDIIEPVLELNRKVNSADTSPMKARVIAKHVESSNPEKMPVFLIIAFVACALLTGLVALVAFAVVFKASKFKNKSKSNIEDMYNEIGRPFMSTASVAISMECAESTDISSLLYADDSSSQSTGATCSDSLEIDPALIDFDNSYTLGRGEFGIVRTVKVDGLAGRGGQNVVAAAKQTIPTAGEEEKNKFLNELSLMKLFCRNHQNVVSLLGCCTQNEPMCIITELEINGSLERYLRQNKHACVYQNLHANSTAMSPIELLHFAWEIAKGMNYLSSVGCLHRDLATRNVLLGEHNICKISDFGLARHCTDTYVEEITPETRLPIRWMAIESLTYNVYTSKSDVWSYGILVWEIVTLGSTPYGNFKSSRQVSNMLRRGYRMPQPEHCSKEIYDKMLKCWNADPNERPVFSELCDVFRHMVNDISQDYLCMRYFKDHLYVNLVKNQSGSHELL